MSAARTIKSAFLGVIAGSLVVEAGLQLIEVTPLWQVLPVADASLYGPDYDTGYALRPNAVGIRTPENRVVVKINALGLRDRLDRRLEKAPATIRWAVIGDSITEGQQVPLEKTFPYLTQEYLDAADQPYEIVNLALAGARPAVIAARLKSRGSTLNLDGVVVIVSASELLQRSPDDTSEFAGYIPDNNGSAILSTAFRGSVGFRLRTGPIGTAIYWAISRSRLALLINNRKNVGFFAEVTAASARPAPATRSCDASPLNKLEALADGQELGFSGARFRAFLMDLADFQKSQHIPVIFALRSYPPACDERALAQLNRLRQLMSQSAARLGLGFADIDAMLDLRMQGLDPRSISGFGARVGMGHLNETGHRLYAAVLRDIIAGASPRP